MYICLIKMNFVYFLNYMQLSEAFGLWETGNIVMEASYVVSSLSPNTKVNYKDMMSIYKLCF